MTFKKCRKVTAPSATVLSALALFFVSPAALTQTTRDRWTVVHSEGGGTGAISIGTASVSGKTKAVLTLSCKTGKHFSLTLVDPMLKAKDTRLAVLVEGQDSKPLPLVMTKLEPNAIYAEDAGAVEMLILKSRSIGIRAKGNDQEEFFNLPDPSKVRPLILIVCPP